MGYAANGQPVVGAPMCGSDAWQTWDDRGRGVLWRKAPGDEWHCAQWEMDDGRSMIFDPWDSYRLGLLFGVRADPPPDWVRAPNRRNRPEYDMISTAEACASADRRSQ